jgi:hypothetical protein
MKPITIIRNIGLLGAMNHYSKKLLVIIGLDLNLDSIKASHVNRLSRSIGHTVKYGPFKGLSLVNKSGWSSNDRVSMLLGTYESRVLDLLTKALSNRSCFIDIGAADGYYAVGVAIQSNVTIVHAFEIDSRSRDLILENANRNSTANKVMIHGEACAKALSEIVVTNQSNSVILIDIEGAEFDLLKSKCLLKKLRNEIIIIELHDFLRGNPETERKDLFDDLSVNFDLFTFTSGPRDVSNIAELKRLPEDIAWLIISEGRRQSMRWVMCLPRNDTNFNLNNFDYLVRPEQVTY